MTPLGPIDEGSHVALVDLVNRLMDRGVLVSGEVVVSVAEVDLLYLNVNLLLSSVESVLASREPGRTSLAPSDTSS